MKLNGIRTVIFPIVILMLASCTRYHINVDSISSGKYTKNSYVLLPGDQSTSASDLQFKEYASYVNRALIKQGFIPAESFQDASLAIFLTYGIGEPEQQLHTYSVPTYGQTGVSSSNTTGTFNTDGSYSGTTTYTPTYGVTGSTTHVDTITTYFRFIVMDAFDLDEYKTSEREVQLWKTTVTSTGTSGDLRIVLPALVAASQEYIGTNTGKKVKINMSTSDGRIAEIKGENNIEEAQQ